MAKLTTTTIYGDLTVNNTIEGTTITQSGVAVATQTWVSNNFNNYSLETHDNSHHSETYVSDSYLSGGTGINYSSGTISTDDANIDHNSLNNYSSNEHIDWTVSQTSDIHSDNYTNTTYSAGSGLSLSGTEFSLSGDSFNMAGTYSDLRAQGTTKDDVGLGNVTNDAQVPKSGGSFTGDVGIGGSGNKSLWIQFDEDNSAEDDLREIEGIEIYNNNDTGGTYSALMFGSSGTASGWVAERIDGNNKDLHFVSEPGLKRVTFKADGDVGIGTTSPSSKLHVSGGTGSVNLLIEADTNNSGEDNQPSITLSQDGGNVLGHLGYFNTSNHLSLYNHGFTDNLTLGTGNTKDLVVINPSGDMSVTGNITASNIGTMANDDKTISTSDPSGGSDGDVWFKV